MSLFGFRYTRRQANQAIIAKMELLYEDTEKQCTHWHDNEGFEHKSKVSITALQYPPGNHHASHF